MLDDLGFDSWQWQEIYLFCIMLKPAVGPTFYWGALLWKWSGQGMKIAHLHLAPWLWLIGAISQLVPYAFMAYVGTALPFIIFSSVCP